MFQKFTREYWKDQCCCFSTQQAAIMSKNKEWFKVSIILCQCGGTFLATDFHFNELVL
jgi:hypothetical protein